MATIEIRDILDNETGETIFPRTHVKAVIGLADSNFFEEYTDGNGVRSVRLRSEYAGLWAEGWISGAGINNGAGGGGGVSNLRELADVYHGGGSVLRANGTPAQTGDTLVYDLTNSRWHAAPAGSSALSPATANSLGGVKVGSVITTPTINPITSIGGRYYYLQADANGLAFVNVPWEGGGGGGGAVDSINVGTTNYQPSSGVVTLPAYPTTLPASDVPSWAKQTSLQFSALPNMYALRTPITGTAANGTLLGVNAISNGSSSTAGSDQSRVEWEPNAGGQGIGAWHFYGNVYADGWMSGAGVSGSNGGGGGVTSLYALNEVLSSTSPTNNQIFYFNGSKWTAISLKTINNNTLLGSGNIDIQGGGGGTITDVTLGGTSVVSGTVAALPSYPTSLPASDVPSWAKQSSLQFSALPNMYVGSTSVSSTKAATAFTGVSSIKATVDTNSETNSIVEWDSSNNAWHFHGNVYADGYVSSGGVGGSTVFLKYVNCATQQVYDNISTKDNSTIYTIGTSIITKVYLGSVLIYSES